MQILSQLVRFKQAADVATQRFKAVCLASKTSDWNKAQAAELVPDDNVDAVVGVADLRRIAKEVEHKHKLQLATNKVAGRNQLQENVQTVTDQAQDRTYPTQENQYKGKGKDKGKGSKDKGKGNKGGKKGKW